MFLPLSPLIFFAAYYEESYQRLCENPRTLCVTGNLYVLNVLFFFFKELQQAEKAQSSLEELWHFHPIMLHKCSILTLIIIFSLPEIFKKPPGL